MKSMSKRIIVLDQLGVKLHWSSKQTVRKWGSDACQKDLCFQALCWFGIF